MASARAWSVLLVVAVAGVTSAQAPPDDTTTTIVIEPLTTTTIEFPLPTTTVTLPIPTTTVTLPEVTTTTTIVPSECVPGTGAGCDDGNPCTQDVCDPAAGCVHFQLADVSLCDDGDPCTENDQCLAGRCAGTPIACDDRVDCTADSCVAGVCQHEPRDALCDRAECEVGTCRPADRKADRRGCVAVPVHEGQACTDDGFACTDDVCTRGVCLHVPVDSRCLAPDKCSNPECVPASAGHDAAGCVADAPRPDGNACAEDGDACTLDVCRDGVCAHVPETAAATCAPVQHPFRQARGLQNLAAGLAADIAPATPVAATLLVRLERIEDDLAGAVAALAGATGPGPALARPAVATGLTAPERARIAFTMVLRTPRQVSAFLQILAEARVRAALGRPAARSLRTRGRALLRGARTLRTELRHVAS